MTPWMWRAARWRISRRAWTGADDQGRDHPTARSQLPPLYRGALLRHGRGPDADRGGGLAGLRAQRRSARSRADRSVAVSPVPGARAGRRTSGGHVRPRARADRVLRLASDLRAVPALVHVVGVARRVAG